jgi:hypothetical protein
MRRKIAQLFVLDAVARRQLSNEHGFFLSRRENHEHLRVRSIMLIIIILYLQQPPPPRPDAEVKSHMKK